MKNKQFQKILFEGKPQQKTDTSVNSFIN